VQNHPNKQTSDMKKLLLTLVVCCVVMLCFAFKGVILHAQPETNLPYTGTITGYSVNLRSGPGANFEILRKLNKSDFVLVVEVGPEWIKIALPRNSKAYVHSGFIVRNNQISGQISADRVNIRAGAGTNFNVVGQLNKNDALEIISKTDDWYYIFPYGNAYGWVHKNFVKEVGDPNIYTNAESKKREGVTLFSEAVNFEIAHTKSKDQQIDLAPVIQRYQAIIRDYPNTLAGTAATERIQTLSRGNTPVKEPAKKPAPKKSKKTAVSKKQKPTVIMPHTGEAVADGKIIEAGRFFRRPGTHKLIDRKKHITFYLKSDNLNLNDYIYHRVKVWGIKQEATKSKIPVIDVTHIEKLN